VEMKTSKAIQFICIQELVASSDIFIFLLEFNFSVPSKRQCMSHNAGTLFGMH